MNLNTILRKRIKEKDQVPVFIVQNHVIWGAKLYEKWIETDPYMRLVSTPAEADVLVFMGGPDISPSIYHQPQHRLTRGVTPDRDRYEIAMAMMSMDKLKVGICRGAQLLNCISGGTLIQHVSGHVSPHALKLLKEGDMIMQNVPSTHHQMMLPSPNTKTRQILAVAYNNSTRKDFIASFEEKQIPDVMSRQKENFFNTYRAADFDPYTQDAEIIYYHNTNSLCIQSHPEKVRSQGPFTAYCNTLIVTMAKRLAARKKEIAHQLGEIICVDT